MHSQLNDFPTPSSETKTPLAQQTLPHVCPWGRTPASAQEAPYRAGVVIVDGNGAELGGDTAALCEKPPSLTIGPHVELVGHGDVADRG